MTSTTPAGSAPGSPRSKIKFLCSQGGKILLRPGDGVLKYVGGDTRVVSVPRNIDFSGLSKKIATLNDGDVILKYQLTHDDLDALVTVRTDQDLRYMLDEYDRHEITGAPKLRAFLFPSCPAITETPANLFDPHSLEQHYIDAVNGVFRLGPKHSNAAAASSSTESSSSPRSVDSVENVGADAIRLHNYIAGRLYMHKVQSSPNISNLANLNHNHYHHHHHHHSGHQSPQNLSGYQSPVVYQYDNKQMLQQPPRRAAAVEQRKAGYPPTIRHLRSVSALFQNEEYVVDDWFSRMR